MSGRAKTAVVIGTGAGGGMIAKELQGKYQVTILEAGGDFKPLSLPIRQLARFRHSGLFFDERLIRLLFPNMLVEKTRDIVMVRGIGVGGTTTLATGNAVRCDGALKALGINLDAQFEELYRELPVTTEHQKNWTETTKKMYVVFEEMGLRPVVTPKLPVMAYLLPPRRFGGRGTLTRENEKRRGKTVQALAGCSSFRAAVLAVIQFSIRKKKKYPT